MAGDVAEIVGVVGICGFCTLHTSNEKKSPKIGNPFWREKQCIFTNQPSYFCLFLAIFAYFCLFANL